MISCIHKNSEKEKQIIGDWGIYVHVFDSGNIMCNSCPKIDFKENLEAVLTFPSGQQESYSWEIRENNLLIDLKNGNANEAHFNKSIYQFEINNKIDFIELKLLASNTDGYILRK